VVLVLAVIALRSLRASGPGRALIAVRDNERAASAYGLNPSLVKISALAISGFLTGMAGAIWGMTQNTWTAEAFEPTLSLVMLSLVIVGGLGTLHGPILGALAVFAWPYLVPGANTTVIRSFSSGALLLIILLFVPGGIASLFERLRQRVLDLLARGKETAEVPPAEALPVAGIGVAAPRLQVATAEARNGGNGSRSGPLEVRDVSITFGGLKALDGAALAVGEWEIVGLIGGNGAGKTTLFNCVNGHLRPGAGVVAIFGDEVTGKPPMRRPNLGLARSFQDAHLYPGLTVLETVLVAVDRMDRSGVLGSLVSAPWVRAGESRKRAAAQEVLSRVGLTDRAESLTGELSTGMRRLCELATVMAAQPRLILLDEPTAGIAQREVEAFRPLLAGLRDQLGCSVLIIEHDVPLLMSLCDWIYALESGTVIAEGKPDDVRADPRVIASYLGTDTAAIERSGSASGSPPGEAQEDTKPRRPLGSKSVRRAGPKTKRKVTRS
jgi:ABC-type branched-subunit amino acid transport system ATPase component